MVYTHLIWAYFFLIYVIMAILGLYAIWTDLKSNRGRIEDFDEEWDLMKPVGKEFKYELDDGQLTDEQYAKIKELAEYELDKSTGEVVKK